MEFEMDCCICGTKIQKNDSFYWEINELESNRPLHTDCLIRLAEFTGDSDQARDIQETDLTEGINRGQ